MQARELLQAPTAGSGAAAASSASSAVDAGQAAGVSQSVGIRSTVRAEASVIVDNHCAPCGLASGLLLTDAKHA